MKNTDKNTDDSFQEIERYRQLAAGFDLLTQVCEIIFSTTNSESTFSEVACLCSAAIDATDAYVISINGESISVTGSDSGPPQMDTTFITEEVVPALTDSPITIHADEPQDYPKTSARLAQHEAKSMMIVPIKHMGECVGIIEIWEDRRKRTFTPAESNLIEAVARQMSMALVNARLVEELRASEKRYRVVADLIADYAFRYDLNPDFNLLHIWPNEASFQKLTGYLPGEYGKHFGLYHPEDRDRVRQDIDMTLKGVATEGEYRIVTKGGDLRWLYVRRQPEWDESGQNIIGFYGVATDITERKELDIQLAYQASLLQNVSDAVISSDANLHLKSWNKGAERMYGWRPDEVIGKHVLELFRTEYYGNPPIGEMVQEFEKTYRWAGEALHRRKDGTQIPVHISSSPVMDNSGNMIGAVAVIRDNTARKELEQRHLENALQQERIQLLEELIADLSHDLKTPLTGITTMVYLIQKNPDPVKQEQYLEKLEIQVERLSNLLEAILTMSRLDKGPGLVFSPLMLTSLLNDIHNQYHHMLREKNLTISLDLSDDLPPILGNEGELNRAFANLIANAINYTPDGGSIHVRAYMQEDGVCVDIHDTGVGIAGDELPHIFERFYRVDGARNTVRGGTGLGLAIVKRIVELHSGKIEVESEPGSGSTFSIGLPISPPAP